MYSTLLFANYLRSSLEGSVIQISDQGLRKVLYQKVGASLPRFLFQEAYNKH